MYDRYAPDLGWALWFTIAVAIWGIIWLLGSIPEWYRNRTRNKRLSEMLAKKDDAQR